MNKEIIKLINKDNFKEYIKTLEFWYLDTLKNIFHLPNMIKDVEENIKKEKDEEKKNSLKGILEANKNNLEENKKNKIYFEELIKYFNDILK